jgi:hypothetical protein
MITTGSLMQAMMRIVPLQAVQVSMPNTRFRAVPSALPRGARSAFVHQPSQRLPVP